MSPLLGRSKQNNLRFELCVFNNVTMNCCFNNITNYYFNYLRIVVSFK